MAMYWGIVFAILIIIIYFAPSVVAIQRKHPKRSGIEILNLFLGWTLIGWVVALVWAKSGESAEDPGKKKCPACAEIIKAEAIVCRYCHKEFETDGLVWPK